MCNAREREAVIMKPPRVGEAGEGVMASVVTGELS